MINVICVTKVVICVATKLATLTCSSHAVHGQMKGTLLAETKTSYLVDFSNSAKSKLLVDVYSKVMVPKAACTTLNGVK